LACVNRGVLFTPFHILALICPATTLADVQRHHEVFAEVVGALFP
jgi:glutamate-1-semialdehyde 2,1-aminomutase